MKEPIFVAQTFELEHVDSATSQMKWFNDMCERALAKGAGSCRMTVMEDKSGLLLEAWSGKLPFEQGEPRWSFSAVDD